MTRSEMIKRLKEVEGITLTSKELADIMDLTYDYLEDMFQRFVADPNNSATEEDLKAFQNGEYLVDIVFKDDEIVYFVGADAQQLANEPRWADDKWDDIDDDVLENLLRIANTIHEKEMKKAQYDFRLDEDGTLYATNGGWTDSYTPDKERLQKWIIQLQKSGRPLKKSLNTWVLVKIPFIDGLLISRCPLIKWGSCGNSRLVKWMSGL